MTETHLLGVLYTLAYVLSIYLLRLSAEDYCCCGGGNGVDKYDDKDDYDDNNEV
jgi:hypothetical protein